MSISGSRLTGESAMKSVLNSLKKTQSNPQFLLALDLKNLQ